MKKISIISLVFLLVAASGYLFYRNYSMKGSLDTKINDEFLKLDYDKQLETIKEMAQNDPAEAWAYLKGIYIKNGQVVGNAHGFAHIVGNQAYKKFGVEGVKVCDESFAFGCFHGVTEMMLLEKGVGGVKAIESECLRLFPPDKSTDYASCIHGTGHGLYSLEKGNTKKALLDCDIMALPYRQYCYDGVFMERSFTAAGQKFSEKDPWKVCTDLPEQYHRNCARYQSQIFLHGSGSGASPLATVGKYCSLGSSGTSQILRETCYESLGYYIAENNLGRPDAIWNDCQNMPDQNGKDICVIGGATETVFQQYGDFANSSSQLCKKLIQSKQVQCFDNFKYLIDKEF